MCLYGVEPNKTQVQIQLTFTLWKSHVTNRPNIHDFVGTELPLYTE